MVTDLSIQNYLDNATTLELQRKVSNLPSWQLWHFQRNFFYWNCKTTVKPRKWIFTNDSHHKMVIIIWFWFLLKWCSNISKWHFSFPLEASLELSLTISGFSNDGLLVISKLSLLIGLLYYISFESELRKFNLHSIPFTQRGITKFGFCSHE